MQSGFTYDDGMAASLAEASEQWYKKSKSEGDDIDQFEPTEDGKGFIRWLVESNKIGKIVGSTAVVGLEWTVFDKETVEKFPNRGHAFGVYVFYPWDVTFFQKKHTEAEEERVIRRLVAQGVDWMDWMETDDPEKLMALLYYRIRRRMHLAAETEIKPSDIL